MGNDTKLPQKIVIGGVEVEVVPSEIEFYWVMVTPEAARAWLGRNHSNRKLRERAAMRIANDIKSGSYIGTNPQPAIFDIADGLMDAQHRMRAVDLANRPVVMAVAINVPRTTQLVIDDHISRQFHDYAHWEMPDMKVTASHGATATMMLNGFGGRKGIKPSRTAKYKFLREHIKAIDLALGLFEKRIAFVTTSATLAVLARASYSHDTERLRRFAQILSTSIFNGPAESAAATLARWLLTRTRLKEGEAYRKTERCLQAFLENEPLSKVFEARQELFPLPGEVLKEETEAAEETDGDRNEAKP